MHIAVLIKFALLNFRFEEFLIKESGTIKNG
jgi:hypothetical protein